MNIDDGDYAPPSRRRCLSDSERRWEAVVLIDAAVQDFVHGGAVSAVQERHGWTDADVAAIEQHAFDRVDGLLRRPRRADRGGSS